MTHISKNEFETLNWLPVKDRFNESKNSIVFKYFTKQCPSYLNEVFELAGPNNLRTRNTYLKLFCPSRKTNMGQNALSLTGPSSNLNRRKINYDLIIITIITTTMLIICLLLSQLLIIISTTYYHNY